MAVASVSSAPGSTLEYVFEIVRHGARGPIIEDADRFKVSASQMLTPQGMRQRYLLGVYNYETYVKPMIEQSSSGHEGIEFDLLSSKDGFLEVQSTDVYRTLQSGYSELHGIFASLRKDRGGQGLKLSESQFKNLEAGQEGTPKFNIRNLK